MIALKLFVLLGCMWLFWAGGNFQHNYRRFVMPLILTATALLLTHFNLWALTMLISIGFLTLGYGIKSPLRHVFGDGFGRGVWGLLVATALSLGLFLHGAIQWYLFVPYLIINFTFENALKKLNQNLGDPIIGAGMASIIFILHT